MVPSLPDRDPVQCEFDAVVVKTRRPFCAQHAERRRPTEYSDWMNGRSAASTQVAEFEDGYRPSGRPGGVSR